jgi:hypothetical protein
MMMGKGAFFHQARSSNHHKNLSSITLPLHIHRWPQDNEITLAKPAIAAQ